MTGGVRPPGLDTENVSTKHLVLNDALTDFLKSGSPASGSCALLATPLRSFTADSVSVEGAKIEKDSKSSRSCMRRVIH